MPVSSIKFTSQSVPAVKLFYSSSSCSINRCFPCAISRLTQLGLDMGKGQLPAAYSRRQWRLKAVERPVNLNLCWCLLAIGGLRYYRTDLVKTLLQMGLSF